MSTNAAVADQTTEQHTEPRPHGERVVVGVDGSNGSRRALEWAIAHTHPSDTIEVLHTWNTPVTAAEAGFAIDPTPFEDAAKATLLKELELASSEVAAAITVTGSLAVGHAGANLAEAAEGADMLVVGTRGRGGFVGLLLGSTSTYLAHHVTCPLVIVPAGSAQDNDSDS